MMENTFIFLLSLIHVSGKLYGPKLLLSQAGESLTIKCYYLTTVVNKHDRKFWCKESQDHKQCQTITSTNDFTFKDYEGRVSIHDSPQNGVLQVTMTQLRKTDSSYYRCGIGKINNGLYARMKVTILEGPNLPLSPELLWGRLSGSVIIHCPSGNSTVEMKRSLCKMRHSGCNSVIGIQTNSIKQQKGRFTFTDSGIPGTFNVLIKELRKQDSGIYKCGTPDDEANTKIIQLEVTEESVFFNIRNDTQVIYESQTICTSSYNYATSSDETYQERFAKNELNLFPIVIPIVVLILAAIAGTVFLWRRQQKKRASSYIPERHSETGRSLASPECSEEHSSRNAGSTGMQECAAGPSKEISSVYCLLDHGTNPTDSGDNE